MNNSRKLTYAILAALGTQAGVSHAAPADATDTSETSGIQEIIVTAQRRSETIENVPITIQAITSQQLSDLRIDTIEDAIKYLPNVQLASNGPGQGNIYMRGLSAGFAGGQSSSTIAPFPNVAVYLDDESMQYPARNVDVYFADMERIEVLEGPQGTLFGGGAEAGAVRYITNKPKLNVTEGNVDASYGVTAHGDPNSMGTATINLPLIDNTLAVRAVIYSDHRGGYINNVPSTFTRMNSDLGNHYAGITPGLNGLCPNGLPAGGAGLCAVPGSPVANNYNLVEKAENPVTYSGIRASALWQISEDWNLLVAQSYQNMNAQGQFDEYPTGSDGQALGPWEITQFSPAWDKDHFENTAWTLNGKVGDIRLVYTGSYLDRHIDNQQDYTNYSRSSGGWYYSCTGGPAGAGALGAGTTPVCYSPVSSWRDQVQNTHLSEELRATTPDDWRLRAIAGVFWEDFQIKDDMNFNYKTVPSCTAANLATALGGGAPCVANVTTAPGSTAVDPGERPDNTAFGEDAQRGYRQTAVFGSADFDILPRVLTVTAGTRWYRYTEDETGSQYGTGTNCVDVPNGECVGGSYHNINAENLNTTYTGFRSRANITWHITPDMMAYYTFSQGFRPGAFNRTVSGVAKDAAGNPQYEKPHGFAPDTLINNEVGLKSEFFDHRMLVNLSVYHMQWENVQLLFFNPVALGNTTFGVNGPDYTINGIELQSVAKVTDGLTLQGSASWNRSKQTNSPCLQDNIPASPNYGSCITEVKGAPFLNPFGALNTVPAFSPSSEFNIRARYDWAFHDYKPWIMAGANHVSSMYNQPATYQPGDTAGEAIPTTTLLRYLQPGYTTYDASVGVLKDNWTVEAFGQNLSNNDASQFTSSAQFIKSEVPLRPRVLGVRVGFKF